MINSPNSYIHDRPKIVGPTEDSKAKSSATDISVSHIPVNSFSENCPVTLSETDKEPSKTIDHDTSNIEPLQSLPQEKVECINAFKDESCIKFSIEKEQIHKISDESWIKIFSNPNNLSS